MILLPLTYLGPLQLFCRYFETDKIQIEQNDTYQKQTYRNRCDIYGANGRLSLCIPVIHERGKRFKVKDTKIDYATEWRRLHWKGLESAYNSSPYFEYYKDIFEPYYRKEFVFLMDLCLHLNDEVLKILKIQEKPELTGEFYPSPALPKDPSPALPKAEGVSSWTSKSILDLRSIIHPKISIEADAGFRIIKYTQVFSQKHGFIPNLSILDLIFNMGPESGTVLKSGLC